MLYSALFLAALATNTASALPAADPQSTSKPRAFQFKVDRSIHRRASTATSLYDDSFAQSDLALAQSKLDVANSRYQAKAAAGKLKLNQKRSVVPEEPFDVSPAKRLRKRQSAAAVTATLTDDVEGGSDVDYYDPNVNFGTPAQTLSIDFDTGSSDLWVPGPDAITSTSSTGGSGGAQGPQGNGQSFQHTAFQSSQSTTFQGTSTPWSIQYGSGEAEGTLGSDIVAIGSLSVSNQVFAVTNTTAQTFVSAPFDGLMGLAFKTISESDSNTWFENLVAANKLASPVFSTYFNRGSSTTSASGNGIEQVGSEGRFIFGGIDSSAYSGSIAYTPVTVQGYWEVALDGLAVNGAVVSNTACSAAIDSGTSLTYFPTSVTSALMNQIGAQSITTSRHSNTPSGYYAVRCSQINSLQLSISLGGSLFAWSGADLNYGYADNSGEYCILSIIGADQQDPEGRDLAIVGDSFLKNVVTVFDLGNLRVGMATSKNSGASSSTSSGLTSQSKSSALPSSARSTAGVLLTVLALCLCL